MAALIDSRLTGPSVLARSDGVITGMRPESRTTYWVRNCFSIERACIVAGLIIVAGWAASLTFMWANNGIGAGRSAAPMHTAHMYCTVSACRCRHRVSRRLIIRTAANSTGRRLEEACRSRARFGRLTSVAKRTGDDGDRGSATTVSWS
jgi:hypothetical protein